MGAPELSFDRLEVTAEPGPMTTVCTAEPGSRSAEALALLAGSVA